jgi:hypothetical protein
MPYVRCPRCGLHSFSAARWSDIDHCGRCAAELPRSPRGEPRDEHGRFTRQPERVPTEQR